MKVFAITPWLILSPPVALAGRARYEMYPGVLDPMKHEEEFLNRGKGANWQNWYISRRHLINYWVRLYKGPNCTDPYGPVDGTVYNFGCSDRCWDVGPTRSILIQAPWWDEAGLGEDRHDLYDWSIFGKPMEPKWGASEIDQWGPVVFAHTFDCKQDYMIDRLVIPKGDIDICHTFEGEPARTFFLRFQRKCGRDKKGLPPQDYNPYDKHLDFTGDGASHHRDYFNKMKRPKPLEGLQDAEMVISYEKDEKGIDEQ